MADKIMRLIAIALVTFGFMLNMAFAQTYRDSSGNIVPGVVPLVSCSASGNCAGPVSNSNPFPTTTTATNPSTIYSGQQTLTASAVALPSQALSNGIVITAKTTNTATVYVGPFGVTTSTGYPLVAGQSISYAVANLSAVYIIGTNTTDVVAFTGN